MTVALLDADIIAYRSAASCEPNKTRDWVEPVEVAIMRVDALMERIPYETGATAYKAFLTGSDNYRTQYNPAYKENRKDVPRPRWLQDCREHLVLQYGATVEDGQEADDALGIAQCASEAGTTVIASIDKDLLMIPGRHYNFVKGEFAEVSPLQGMQWFYTQLIMGDKSDNVEGYDGKMRTVVPKFLNPLLEELYSLTDYVKMYQLVAEAWASARGEALWEKPFMMAAHCLWIRRKEDEFYRVPT